MVNLQSGNYTLQQTDNTRLVSFSSSSALACTLPSASANCWSMLFWCAIENRGTGTLTLQPAAGTIDGAASLALAQNQGVILWSDGTNWHTMRGMGSGSSLGNQNANTVYAGPASGAAAAPTFRALVAADLPVFVASGASHAAGAVPDPGSTAGCARFLNESAQWVAPILGSLYVATDQSTTSTTDVDLATADSVSITLPAAGDITIIYNAVTYNVTAGNATTSSIYVDGTLAASVDSSNVVNGAFVQQTLIRTVTGLAAGAHTVDVKHHTGGATGHWLERSTLVFLGP